MSTSLSARRRLAPHDLVYTVAPDEWIVGAPLGNGHLGAMLWGNGHPLCLTLDRDDLWDLRRYPVHDPNYSWETVREAVKRRDAERVNEVIERTLNPTERATTPTKLPLGRIELAFDGDNELTGRLSLGDATFRGSIGTTQVDAYVAAESPFIVLRVRGATKAPSIRFRGLTDLNPDEAAKLDLPPVTLASEGAEGWAVQDFPDGGRAVVAWRTLRRGQNITIVVTVTTHDDFADPLSLARQRTDEAIGHVGRIAQTHTDWWSNFWDRSQVSIPDGELETLWHYGLYKLASSSRPGHLPANLQGLWVTDGVLPPWRGDYHANMNVQETYWPIYGANHLELGLPLYDWLDRIAPRAAERTRAFFGFDGLRIETALATDGTNVPGWGTVQYWPGAAAWLAHHLWLHWRYTQDAEFLRNRAYPFLTQCSTFWEHYLEPDESGVLHVPLSHNPEWEGSAPAAWGRDTTVDLALVRALFGWCIEASEILDVDTQARERWRGMRERLAPYHRDDDGGLRLMESISTGEPVSYRASHRHPSHLMPIFPMSDITVEGDDDDRRTIAASLHRIEHNGPGEWTGWSFPYVSLIASRARRSEMAAYMLHLYADSFVMPNGMHVNGDWRGRGICFFHYRPYTMEAECAASAAVTEMLLQSWGGRIRLFPAVPASWRDCSFTHLLAEGAVTVSAERRAGCTLRAEFTARRDASVVIDGLAESASWANAKSATYRDGLWHVSLGGGKTATASVDVPPSKARRAERTPIENMFGFHGWDA